MRHRVLTVVLIKALPRAERPHQPLRIAMNRTLSSAQRTWVTAIATTVTLLAVILLGLAG
ncbi:hypothetical protein GCM10023214_00520 [Amycolatopsis dongchuanensis]